MIPFPEKKYKTIYADPPWSEVGGGKIRRGADAHYPLMKTKDIIALPVNEIADDNCHLYLWTTNNFLPDALKVMEAWGFTYKTTITWMKDRIGLGQYFRGLTEHCLFGVKGVLPYKIIDDKRCQGKTGFYASKGDHSQKPKEMRDMIELVSYEPYIELFARERFENWDCWGNEVQPNKTDLSLRRGIMNCVVCGKEIEKSKFSNKVLCSSECFHIDYWNGKVEIKDDPRSVRVNGEQYIISDENSKNSFRGFGGDKFKIRFFNGREVVSTNLWYNGVIPEGFKNQLPDNAEFVH